MIGDALVPALVSNFTGILRVVAATLIALGVFGLLSRPLSKTYRQLGAVAIVGHSIVGVVIPLLPYGWDIPQFHQVALLVLQGANPNASTTVGSFAGFQSAVYAVFGADPRALSVINGLLTVLAVAVACDLARSLYPDLERTDLLAGVLLFLPLPFVYLTVPMRDALGLLLFLTTLAAVVRAYRTRRPVLALPALPLTGALNLIRPELVVVTVAGVAAGMVVAVLERATTDRLRVRDLSAVAGFLGVAALPLVGPRLPVASIARRMRYRTHGGAAYLLGSDYGSWLDLVLAAPTRAIYFQFAPFPLHVNEVFDLVAVAMLPILIVLAVAAYRSARSVRADRAVLVGLAVVYLLGIVGYGLVDANFGTTVRHRIPFTFLLAVFAAPTMARWERRLRAS